MQRPSVAAPASDDGRLTTFAPPEPLTRAPRAAPVRERRRPPLERRPDAPSRPDVRAPAAVTALILAAAAFTLSPLVVSPDTMGATSLERPLAYLALAPICDLYDAMSLLSTGQHVAVVAGVVILVVAWNAVRWHLAQRGGTRWPRRGTLCLARYAASSIGGVLLVYGAGILVPRPVVSLAVGDPDVVRVDFHSHTSGSWDGRRDFTLEQNRRWHARTGFDVAYITDHARVTRVVGAAVDGGPVLLPGIELRHDGEHLVAIGVDQGDSAAFANGDLDPVRLSELVRTRGGDAPLLLLTLPGHPAFARTHADIEAIESFDGAPRGLAQLPMDGKALDDALGGRDIPLIAGSNNHGWGISPGAWSLVRIPGWRSMAPGAVDAAIRRSLREKRRRAAAVAARRRLPLATGAGTVLTLPALALHVARTLTWPERLSWLVWVWGIWMLGAWRRRSRRASTTASVARQRAAPSLDARRAS